LVNVTKRQIEKHQDEMVALRSFFVQDALTGEIRRKHWPVGHGGKSRSHRLRVYWNGQTRSLAHIAWALTHGEWPLSQVYRRNRLSGDLRPSNLTLDPSDRLPPVREIVAHKGVVFDPRRRKWRAFSPVHTDADGRRRRTHLGWFDCRNEAIQKRLEHSSENFL